MKVYMLHWFCERAIVKHGLCMLLLPRTGDVILHSWLVIIQLNLSFTLQKSFGANPN